MISDLELGDGDQLDSGKASVHSYNSDHYLRYGERLWRHRQPWLESQGYMLRPRFRPGWTPSWTANGAKKRDAEDAVRHTRPSAIDATRISDGKFVYIKRVETAERGTREIDISLFFSAEPRRTDPRNHCVPILDVLHHPEEGLSYLIIPALRPFDSPLFLNVGEAVDFFHQIFEGLLFMHENYVVHRDCGDLNVMMDASRMYPHSFHPTQIKRSREFKGKARHLTRTESRPKYYLIDFGLSRQYDPIHDPWPPLAAKVEGVDKSVPEYQGNHKLHNPFPTDVYYLGNLVREHFLQRYRGLGFMKPLILRMVSDEPNARPTMQEAVAELQAIRHTLTKAKLQARLPRRGEFPVARAWRAGTHLLRLVRYHMRSIQPLAGTCL